MPSFHIQRVKNHRLKTVFSILGWKSVDSLHCFSPFHIRICTGREPTCPWQYAAPQAVQGQWLLSAGLWAVSVQLPGLQAGQTQGVSDGLGSSRIKPQPCSKGFCSQSHPGFSSPAPFLLICYWFLLGAF